MSKDRKAKMRTLGATVGISAGVIAGVGVALALTLGASLASHEDGGAIYPSPAPVEQIETTPPAP